VMGRQGDGETGRIGDRKRGRYREKSCHMPLCFK
jgi:hypothetical protein